MIIKGVKRIPKYIKNSPELERTGEFEKFNYSL